MSEIKSLVCTKHGGKEIGVNNFYRAPSNSVYSGIGYVAVCKNCIDKYYEEYTNKYKNEEEAIYYLCMLLDLPFSHGNYEGAVLNSEKTGWKLYQSFFKQLNSFGEVNSSGTCFADSDILHQNKSKIDDSNSEAFGGSDNNSTNTANMISTWGRGLKDWEYEFLDNELFKLKTDFECSDYGMEMIMKDISFINLEIYKARNQSNSKAVADLIKTRSSLMNDGNLKPIQATGADKNEKVSLGVFIKKWENEKPIEEKMDDEMKRYIDTYMVGHLAEMQGLKNDFVDNYKKSIEEYTIDFEDLYSEDGDS